MTEHETYLCTRPKLMYKLTAAGYEPTVKPNPFDATKIVWEFRMDNRLAEIVAEFYSSIGKQIPKYIEHYLATGSEEGEAK